MLSLIDVNTLFPEILEGVVDIVEALVRDFATDPLFEFESADVYLSARYIRGITPEFSRLEIHYYCEEGVELYILPRFISIADFLLVEKDTALLKEVKEQVRKGLYTFIRFPNLGESLIIAAGKHLPKQGIFFYENSQTAYKPLVEIVGNEIKVHELNLVGLTL